MNTRNNFGHLFSCSIVIVCAALITVAQSRFPGNKEAKPYTVNLQSVDKVELLELQRKGDVWNGGIKSTKTLEGVEAQKVASLWRSQTYLPYSAICHLPAYAIKFYSQDKLLVYATLCWECDNIRFKTPDLTQTQGFGGGDKKGQRLLGVFRKAFPSTEKGSTQASAQQLF